jgi:hypothetical protein
MIRIAVTSAELLAAIGSKSPRWMERAEEKKAAALVAGKVGEGDGIWSEIKEIFILRQEFKCIYCEWGQPDSVSEERGILDSNEGPLLLFPFGEDGDDPAEYLAFRGPTVRPLPVAGHERLRGQAVIDFFELDTREGLLELRCWLIQLLWGQLEDRASPDARKKAKAEAFLETVEKTCRYPHTACGRAFIELYGNDRDMAERWQEAASGYLTSKDPVILKAIA